MKIAQQIYQNEELLYSLEVTPSPPMFPNEIHVGTKSKQFNQTLLFKSEDSKYTMVECLHPPIITNLKAFGQEYGFCGWIPKYMVHRDNQEEIYTAYFQRSSPPIHMMEPHKFLYMGYSYDCTGEPTGQAEVIITCRHESLQLICSRYGLPLPKRNIIMGPHDLVTLLYANTNMHKPIGIRYHDIRAS